MIIPYNASTSSIIEYIKENFDKQKNPNFSDNTITNTGKDTDYYIYKLKGDIPTPVIFTELDFKNLRKTLNYVIFVDYSKLSALAEYLKGVAKVSNILNIPIP